MLCVRKDICEYIGQLYRGNNCTVVKKYEREIMLKMLIL